MSTINNRNACISFTSLVNLQEYYDKKIIDDDDYFCTTFNYISIDVNFRRKFLRSYRLRSFISYKSCDFSLTKRLKVWGNCNFIWRPWNHINEVSDTDVSSMALIYRPLVQVFIQNVSKNVNHFLWTNWICIILLINSIFS